jgi:peptidoglycan/LPS O-acetylase OafA/YrhL
MASHAFQRIPALDGVRGLAVTMLVLSHFMISDHWHGNAVWNVLHGGWLGVDMFFVLSGFLITGILIDTKSSKSYFLNFYKRRTLRIFPLYYFCLLIAYIVVYYVENRPPLEGYNSFGWFFGYASNVAIALNGDWTVQGAWVNMGHFWSLAVEEQFYLFWPLVVYFLPNRALIWVSAIIVFFGPSSKEWINEAFNNNTLASYVMTPSRMDALAAGAFLAAFLRNPSYEQNDKSNKITLFLITIWGLITLRAAYHDNLAMHWQGAMFLFLIFILLPTRIHIARIMVVYGAIMTAEILMHGGSEDKWTFPILLFFGILFLSIQKGLVRKFFENKFLMHMGKYSYAMYVFHHFLKPVWMHSFGTKLFEKLDPLSAQLSYIAIAGILTYLSARLSWIILEKPLLDLKDKWAPHKQ